MEMLNNITIDILLIVVIVLLSVAIVTHIKNLLKDDNDN
jgi:hypothetical protein